MREYHAFRKLGVSVLGYFSGLIQYNNVSLALIDFIILDFTLSCDYFFESSLVYNTLSTGNYFAFETELLACIPAIELASFFN